MNSLQIELLNGQKFEAPWPSDELWLARNKRRRLIERTVKGESVYDVENDDEAGLELFQKMIGDPAFSDVAEASLLVEKLAASEVSSVERVGEVLEVTLDSFLGEQKFTLRRPTAVHVKRFRNFVTRQPLGKGRTALLPQLPLAAGIFDELCDARETPIIHKVNLVSAVIAEVQRVLEPSVRP